MTGLLEDKTAVVTGAASGIGRQIAQRFVDEGASVVVADIREEPRQESRPTHERIVQEGGDAVFVECDVTDRDDLEAAVTAADDFGGIDIMVNNAGIIGPIGTFTEMTPEDYRELMAVNLDGVVYGAQIAALRMLKQDTSGSIVNMSSVAGINGVDAIVPYSTAKGGIRLFTYALAGQLGPEGIRVNAIHPGIIETAMTTEDLPFIGGGQDDQFKQSIPLRRFGSPKEVADVAVFLASELASYVTAESVVVGGGATNTL